MRRPVLLLVPLGVLTGLAAERAAYVWAEPRDWLPDLLTGWTLIGCGLVAWVRQPPSRVGVLLSATGFAWFAGNFVDSRLFGVGSLAAWLLYLHRGPLLQLVVEYPTGRAARLTDRIGAALAWVAAIVEPVWRNAWTTIALAGIFTALAGRAYAVARGRERRERRAALQATGFLCAVLAVDAAARLAFPVPAVAEATRLAYEGALCVLAVALAAGVVREPWKRAAVGDLVAALGSEPATPVRDALARALGDPSLRVGYWLDDTAEYVDAEGHRFELPSPDSGRRMTRIDRAGEPVAVIVHDPAVLDDPGLVEGAAAATSLGAANARLQAEVQARLAELRASRRRLVEAGDEERRRLEKRLREGAELRLLSVQSLLGTAGDLAAAGAPATVEQVERANARLAVALSELAELAAGLHPRALAEGGLTGALPALGKRSTIPVDVSVSCPRLPAELEATAYFVCSEALANVSKHARASRADIAVTTEGGRLEVAVADDGVGGAEARDGSGLSGLADRVEAVGGTLVVESRPGEGTRVTASLPLSSPGSARQDGGPMRRQGTPAQTH